MLVYSSCYLLSFKLKITHFRGIGSSLLPFLGCGRDDFGHGRDDLGRGKPDRPGVDGKCKLSSSFPVELFSVLGCCGRLRPDC